MSNGIPDLKGSILIDTSSVKRAVGSVREMKANLVDMAKEANTSTTRVVNGINRQEKAYKDLKLSLDGLSDDTKQLIVTEKKREVIISKAATKIANFEAAVRKTNLTEKQQVQIITEAAQALHGYERAVDAGADSGLNLQLITTQLNGVMAELQRDVSATSAAIREQAKDQAKADAESKKATQTHNSMLVALAKVEDEYNELSSAVDRSLLGDKKKAELLTRLKSDYNAYTQAIQKHGQKSTQATNAGIAFGRATKTASGELKGLAKSRKEANVAQAASDFRNLTSSVVVALGPLSGVAARMTALQGIFDRNAVSVGAFLAAMTGVSVLFAKSASTAQMAEQQMKRLEGQLSVIGDSAQVTAEEIDAMAHKLAAATLLSASQVRDAAGALLEFGDIGRDQFDDVILAAQGMSATLGGDLRENLRKLGRVMENPVRNMESLREKMGEVPDAVAEQVVALRQSGKIYESNNVLLEHFSSLMNAAKSESQSLSGAYDTVSGNLDKLFEQLMNGSGALQAITDNVNRVAKAIEAFSGSKGANALEILFAKISEFGGGVLTAAISNVGLLTSAFALLVGTSIPLVIRSLLSMTNAITFNVIPATGAWIASTIAAKAAVDGASQSVVKLDAKLKLFGGGLGRVIFAVVQVAVATLAYFEILEEFSELTTEAEAAQSDFSSGVVASVNAIINANGDLTKSQADRFRKEVEQGEAAQAAVEKQLQETLAARNESEKLLTDLTQKQTALRLQIEKKAADLREELQKRGMETGLTAEMRSELMSLATELSSVTKDATDQRLVLEKLVGLHQNLTTESNNNKESMKALGIEIAKTTAKQSDAIKPIEQARNILEDMSEQYDKQFIELTKYREALASAKMGLELMQKSGKGTSAEMAKFQRIIAELTGIVNGLEFDKAADSAQKFFDNITNAENELFDLKEAMRLGFDAEPTITMNREMQNLHKTITDIADPAVVAKLADMLNVSGGDQTGVADALVARVKTIREQAIEQEKLNGYQQNLNDIMDEQKGKVDVLKEKTRQMMSVITSPEEGAALAKWYMDQVAQIEKSSEQAATSQFTGGNLAALEEEYQQRLAIIQNNQELEQGQVEQHIETLEKQYAKAKFFQQFANGAEQAGAIVGSVMDSMAKLGRKNSKDYKNMAIGQALIQGAQAQLSIWAGLDPTPSFVQIATKSAAAATAAAATGAQLSVIRNQQFANGGLVRGPGTGRSDSISAMLSNGEFVMSASAVKRLGVGNLERMNKGQVPMLNTGGLIGTTSPGSFSANTNVQIVDQSTGQKEFTVEESTNQFGQREIKVMIQSAMKEGLMRGEFDREMGSRFGVRNQGRRL